MLSKKTFYQTVEELKNNYTNNSSVQSLNEFKTIVGSEIKMYIENGVLAELIFGEFDLFREIAKTFRNELQEKHFTLLWEQMYNQKTKMEKQFSENPELEKKYYKAISYLSTNKRRAKISNECVIKMGNEEGEEQSYISKNTICKYLRTSPNKMPIDFLNEKMAVEINKDKYYLTKDVLDWVNEHFSLKTAKKGLYKSFFDFPTFYTLQELSLLCEKKHSKIITSLTEEDIRVISKICGRSSIVLPYISYNVDALNETKNIILLGYPTLLTLYSIFKYGIINLKIEQKKTVEIENELKNKMSSLKITVGNQTNNEELE